MYLMTLIGHCPGVLLKVRRTQRVSPHTETFLRNILYGSLVEWLYSFARTMGWGVSCLWKERLLWTLSIEADPGSV